MSENTVVIVIENSKISHIYSNNNIKIVIQDKGTTEYEGFIEKFTPLINSEEVKSYIKKVSNSIPNPSTKKVDTSFGSVIVELELEKCSGRIIGECIDYNVVCYGDDEKEAITKIVEIVEEIEEYARKEASSF